MASKRQGGLNESQPIAWAEIHAWARLQRIDIEPWQVDAIAHLDDLWRAAARDGREKPKPKSRPTDDD